jgi:NADPH:quinone reductase-like Zn-dependent oxidoreductase
MTNVLDNEATEDPMSGEIKAINTTMKAIVQDIYGSAEVLHLEEIERPSIKSDEVLVEVRAAGLDRGTWHLMVGKPYLIRIMGFGFRAPKQPISGLDLSGTVVAVGSDVSRFSVGDEVFGTGKGSFAEYATAREDDLVKKPSSLKFEQAAVVPVSGTTAIQGLRDVGRIEDGQSVLIIGASGGVGSFAVQIAKSYGAQVTGVCSTSKIDLVCSLGADHVVDYTHEDFADGAHKYDLILDIGGNSSLSRLRRALARTGTLVIVGGEDGGNWTGGIGRQLRAFVMSIFLRQRLTSFISKANGVDLESLIPLLDSGDVTPIVDKTYSLAQAPAAMNEMVEGRVRGKIAVTI